MVGKVKRLKKITDCLLSVAFYICILIIGWLVLQTTCFTTFTIPSDSMAPTLQAGDRILVNKWIMGARMLGCIGRQGGEDSPAAGSRKG